VTALAALLLVDGVVPAVPAVPVGSVAPVALCAPSSSLRIRSTAATSAPHLGARFASLLPASLADFSSELMCRLSSPTRAFAVPVSDAAGMSLSAASAWRRCSLADPGCAASAGCCAEGGDAGEEVWGACARAAPGTASSAVAAIALVHPAVERFIGWLLLEENLSNLTDR
jgi:hypothetical protein